MKLPPGVTNPNKHPLCQASKCVEIRGSRGTVQLKISDTCPACAAYDVDVADEIFPHIEDPFKGRVKVQWRFINCNFLEGESIMFWIRSERREFSYEKSSWTKWIWNR